MTKVFCLFVFTPVWDFKPDDGTGSIAFDRDEAKPTSSTCVFESHPENIIGVLFQNTSPEECQKVVDELPTAKTILSSNIITVHPQNCQRLLWQVVIGASRRAGSASMLGWSTVLPQVDQFAIQAHCSARVGPRKASLSTPFSPLAKEERVVCRSLKLLLTPRVAFSSGSVLPAD